MSVATLKIRIRAYRKQTKNEQFVFFAWRSLAAPILATPQHPRKVRTIIRMGNSTRNIEPLQRELIVARKFGIYSPYESAKKRFLLWGDSRLKEYRSSGNSGNLSNRNALVWRARVTVNVLVNCFATFLLFGFKAFSSSLRKTTYEATFQTTFLSKTLHFFQPTNTLLYYISSVFHIPEGIERKWELRLYIIHLRGYIMLFIYLMRLWEAVSAPN